MAEGLGKHTTAGDTWAGAAGGDRAHVGRVPVGQAHELTIEILDPQRLLSSAAMTDLRHLAAAAAARLPGSPTGEVRVRVVADAEMAEAHLKYSNIPGTTDVLTFDLSEGASAEGGPLDVDILVCVDEAKRQAERRGHALERELLLYIVHGVLHCLGHDDHDDDAYVRMHALEDEILEAIGVGRVFTAAPSSSSAQEPA